jgi:hypothetical protein
MTVGDIVKTSVDNPEGGLGTFSPMLMNLVCFIMLNLSQKLFMPELILR